MEKKNFGIKNKWTGKKEGGEILGKKGRVTRGKKGPVGEGGVTWEKNWQVQKSIWKGKKKKKKLTRKYAKKKNHAKRKTLMRSKKNCAMVNLTKREWEYSKKLLQRKNVVG